MVTHASSGKFVVAASSGGDPFVFGRGGEEMLACLRAGVPVTVVPPGREQGAIGRADGGGPAGHPAGGPRAGTSSVISVHVAAR